MIEHINELYKQVVSAFDGQDSVETASSRLEQLLKDGKIDNFDVGWEAYTKAIEYRYSFTRRGYTLEVTVRTSGEVYNLYDCEVVVDGKHYPLVISAGVVRWDKCPFLRPVAICDTLSRFIRYLTDFSVNITETKSTLVPQGEN